MAKKKSYMQKYLESLVGRKIVSVDEGGSEDQPDTGPFPSFTLDNGWKIEVSRDEEGNGPGFLFGLPEPK